MQLCEYIYILLIGLTKFNCEKCGCARTYKMHPFKCDILPFQEPPCRICTRLVPPAAFDPRTLESRYKSPVTRRREHCDSRRCNAKVGTDSKSKLDSRSYNVDRIVNKIEELNRNVQHLSRSKCHDEAVIYQQQMLFILCHKIK